MKTIKELNEKIWYRLFKIVYIAFFIIVFIIGNLVAYENLTYTEEVYCDNNINEAEKTHSTIQNYLNDENIAEEKRQYVLDIIENNKQTTLDEVSVEEIMEISEEFPGQNLSRKPLGPIQFEKRENGISEDEIADGIIQKYGNIYSPVEETVCDYETHLNIDTLKWLTIFIGIVFLAFGGLRRAFYYIILGSFKPKDFKNIFEMIQKKK